MAKDFPQTNGSVNSGVSDERKPTEGGATPTGFNDGPKGERVPMGPGPGIGANSHRIS